VKRKPKMMAQVCFSFLCLALSVACISPAAHIQKGVSIKNKKEDYRSISKEEGKLDIPTSKIITLPYDDASHPVVMGQEMYVAINTKWGYLRDEVRKINLNTKKETTLFKTEYDPSAINHLQGNEEWLVWVDSTEDGYNNNIWTRNLKTGEMKKIYQQPFYSHILIIPVLYDHYVAWTDEKREGVVTVRLMDLETGKAEDIAQYHTFSPANYVNVDPVQGRLIWNDSKNGIGFFKVFDLKTRQITTYPLSGYTPGYSRFVGNDYILFRNSKDNFATWINPPICIYNMKTKQYQTLSEDENNHDFRVVNNRIFYIDNEGVQSLILENSQFKKTKISHQLKNLRFMYTPNNHLILEKGNEKDGRSVSTTFEIIDLTQVK
jgi:hypothetical protein